MLIYNLAFFKMQLLKHKLPGSEQWFKGKICWEYTILAFIASQKLIADCKQTH